MPQSTHKPLWQKIPSHFPNTLIESADDASRLGDETIENRKVIEYSGERRTWAEDARLARDSERRGEPRNVYRAYIQRRTVIRHSRSAALSFTCHTNCSVPLPSANFVSYTNVTVAPWPANHAMPVFRKFDCWISQLSVNCA